MSLIKLHMKRQNKKRGYPSSIMVLTLTEIFLLNFSLRNFPLVHFMPLHHLLFPFVNFAVCAFLVAPSASAVDFDDAHLLFLFECVIMSTLQASVRKERKVHVYVRMKTSVMRFFFWLGHIFVSNLLRKRCLQAKF